MPTRRGPKNNVLAAIFLLTGLALALAIFFILSNVWERLTVPTTRYHVRFSLADGADGLIKGAPVKVGGERVGQVVGWRFITTPDGRPEAVGVEIQVRSEITFYEDARAMLMLPLLGSNSSINFADVGDGSRVQNPQGGDPRLAEGEWLDGRRAPPSFLAQAGYGPEQAQQVQKILKDASETTDRINRITQKVETELDPTLEKFRQITTDVSGITSDAGIVWKDWKEAASATLKALEEGSRKLAAMIDENEPKVNATIDDLSQLSHKLNTDTYATLMSALEKGDKGMTEFVQAAERANAALGRRIPDLETTLANARLASDQLKLTLTEVRQAPWKLLNKPTGRKDLENEVLYDSVRAYAVAVSDLRSASEALQSMTAGGPPRSETEQRTIQEITEELKRAFQRYQQAEKDFLARWSEAKQ